MGSLHIKDVIESLTKKAVSREKTVDGLLSGDPETIVTGIAATHLATMEIIEQAAAMSINLLISHEGIYFSHQGNVSSHQGNVSSHQGNVSSHRERDGMSKNDSVFQEKNRRIEELGVAIYRLHDHIHDETPDGIAQGVLEALGWEGYRVGGNRTCDILELPGNLRQPGCLGHEDMRLDEVITHLKEKLGISSVRAVGDLSTACRRAGLFVGYRGSGDTVIPIVESENLDLVICGEGPEWETPEYFRDAVYQGRNKALVVLGHGESEALGMWNLATSLQKRYPGIPIHYIPYQPAFRIF